MAAVVEVEELARSLLVLEAMEQMELAMVLVVEEEAQPSVLAMAAMVVMAHPESA